MGGHDGPHMLALPVFGISTGQGAVHRGCSVRCSLCSQLPVIWAASLSVRTAQARILGRAGFAHSTNCDNPRCNPEPILRKGEHRTRAQDSLALLLGSRLHLYAPPGRPSPPGSLHFFGDRARDLDGENSILLHSTRSNTDARLHLSSGLASTYTSPSPCY
ncbi:hypothetical protein BCV69DRAFT_158837 [Microstroma glucosiphilum]|uniref:Uncharacterized protein n=1 Tax=Pseudomicrostroma glucosiphilum TaxID=1684307 RepID=A0A316U9L0_9BASI|nr:hypothetical protein BCV69DRAFT_158837 [Pseudomicrostroma glucosiphilum]PWN21896.1 hypothetical protein BCV69DRAFT_158837 [Pseudomicrostroma glucosiphilum]